MLRVLSCRTATVWRTLCPFWGEEYQVHLPPTFHAVAFYVMDEDALRSVAPMLLGGLHPPSAPLWPISLLGLLVTLHPLYSLEGGGVQEGLEGCRGECVCACLCVDSLCLHRVCLCGIQAQEWCVSMGCALGSGRAESMSLACVWVHGQYVCSDTSHAQESRVLP